MRDRSDAFGHTIWDAYRTGTSLHVIERDDGLVNVMDAAVYLAPPSRWSAHERRAVQLARGSVLDIGCGAGRHALAMQSRGLRVRGIDTSPLAIRTARARGLHDARVLDVRELARGSYDTIIMLGNNFGLLGAPKPGRRLLHRFHDLTTNDARIIAESNDVHRTRDPVHLAYHVRNRARGRLPGQLRLRVRYRDAASPWFDYLMVSLDEMRAMVEGTGWHVTRTLRSRGSAYIAVLEKDPPHSTTRASNRPRAD
jgi:SAM-dependent methyltransferase